MRWQDLPVSNNIQDMTYGPQLPVAPWSMGPQMPRWAPPTPLQQLSTGPRPPLSAAQNRWLQQNMPEQLPTTPLPDPSAPQFVTQGSSTLGHWQQNANGSWTHNPGQAEQAGYSMPPPAPLPPAPGRPGPAFIPGPLSNQWNGY
jgi:hypothetical protein